MTHKSPFKVYQNFLSEDEAFKLAGRVKVTPDTTEELTQIDVQRTCPDEENEIFVKLRNIQTEIEDHFDLKIRGVEHPTFQQFHPRGGPVEEPGCQNSSYKRKKWIKIRDRDLTGILWLKNYKDTKPFDLEHNVYGGKLEFPMYNFGFQPQAGTLIVYPSGPHFISATSSITIGELQAVRIHFACDGAGGALWMYDPQKFNGDYTQWFNDVV